MEHLCHSTHVYVLWWEDLMLVKQFAVDMLNRQGQWGRISQNEEG